MNSPIIKTVNLVKRYQIGDVVTKAVNGISLEIYKGEFVAIDGMSGSGKSTLLHLLSLLDRPTSGQVLINGDDTAHYSRSLRVQMRLATFGYVFQDYALIPELTALENVMLPYFMETGCYGDCLNTGKGILERVGLGKKFDNLPSQLSGGEQQRVSIARALVNKPEVFFADEPTANLDSDTSNNIMNIIKELHMQGITVLMVTHEPEYAHRAERIITMSDGEIVA